MSDPFFLQQLPSLVYDIIRLHGTLQQLRFFERSKSDICGRASEVKPAAYNLVPTRRFKLLTTGTL